jgi:hypothetical protein
MTCRTLLRHAVSSAALLCAIQRGKEERSKDGDDCNYDKKLDQGKPSSAPVTGIHTVGAWAGAHIGLSLVEFKESARDGPLSI